MKRAKKLKAVRVDHKTVILVDKNKPNDQAVKDFTERLEHSRNSSYSYGKIRTHIPKP